MGIFPYVLKLLQSSARELRPLLVFIWAKILAVDSVSNLLYPHGWEATLCLWALSCLPSPSLCQLPDDQSVFWVTLCDICTLAIP